MVGIDKLRGRLFLGAMASVMFGSLGAAETATVHVLHHFDGTPDGSHPYSDLIRDSAGNLYGTTYSGGSVGYGTVFQIAPDGTETVLHSFSGQGNDGYPQAGVTLDKAGNIYGTTNVNGGLLFELAPDGTYTVLHTFGSGTDASYPSADLIRDKNGNFYGTTVFGGKYNGGAVFKFAVDGTETVLHSFAGGSVDGAYPYGALLRDSSGNLYGTAGAGGTGTCNCGIVFKLGPKGKETILYSFAGGADGATPFSTLARDASGNLIGTTGLGGANKKGTIFEIAPTGTETVLYSFAGKSTGEYPYAGVILDKSGNLYGTTVEGGAGSCSSGCGLVFQLSPTGTETVLYPFTDGSDSDYPLGRLLLHQGHLYGTTYGNAITDNGAVFELKK